MTIQKKTLINIPKSGKSQMGYSIFFFQKIKSDDSKKEERKNEQKMFHYIWFSFSDVPRE
jgi:hypothetical protein